MSWTNVSSGISRYGCLALLTTLPGHRRRGHARRCLSAACRRLLGLGLTPYATVEADNRASGALFAKVGFRASHAANYVVYEPR